MARVRWFTWFMQRVIMESWLEGSWCEGKGCVQGRGVVPTVSQFCSQLVLGFRPCVRWSGLVGKRVRSRTPARQVVLQLLVLHLSHVVSAFSFPPALHPAGVLHEIQANLDFN